LLACLLQLEAPSEDKTLSDPMHGHLTRQVCCSYVALFSFPPQGVSSPATKL